MFELAWQRGTWELGRSMWKGRERRDLFGRKKEEGDCGRTEAEYTWKVQLRDLWEGGDFVRELNAEYLKIKL